MGVYPQCLLWGLQASELFHLQSEMSFALNQAHTPPLILPPGIPEGIVQLRKGEGFHFSIKESC